MDSGTDTQACLSWHYTDKGPGTPGELRWSVGLFIDLSDPFD
jgi:hypothetical protein